MVIRLKRCPRCLRNVERDAPFCPGCGGAFEFRASRYERDQSDLLPPPPTVEPAPHDVTIALTASLLAVGTGQLYNRQFAKAAVLFFATVLTMYLAFRWWSYPLATISTLLWMVSIVDAAMVAGRILNHELVTPWQWF